MVDSNEKIRLNDVAKIDILRGTLREVVETVRVDITKDKLIETFTKLLDPRYHESFINHIESLPDELIENMGKRLQKNIKKMVVYFKDNSVEKKIPAEIVITRNTENDDIAALTKFDKYLVEVTNTIKKVKLYINH
jgi:hypothetical protein